MKTRQLEEQSLLHAYQAVAEEELEQLICEEKNVDCGTNVDALRPFEEQEEQEHVYVRQGEQHYGLVSLPIEDYRMKAMTSHTQQHVYPSSKAILGQSVIDPKVQKEHPCTLPHVCQFLYLLVVSIYFERRQKDCEQDQANKKYNKQNYARHHQTGRRGTKILSLLLYISKVGFKIIAQGFADNVPVAQSIIELLL